MSIALGVLIIIVVVAIVMFRNRLPHVARSMHHAQREFRGGGPNSVPDPNSAPAAPSPPQEAESGPSGS